MLGTTLAAEGHNLGVLLKALHNGLDDLLNHVLHPFHHGKHHSKTGGDDDGDDDDSSSDDDDA